jgi:hypothetical protein
MERIMQYLDDSFRLAEGTNVARDHLREAFRAVGKHVAKLEKRIEAIEKAQGQPRSLGR